MKFLRDRKYKATFTDHFLTYECHDEWCVIMRDEDGELHKVPMETAAEDLFLAPLSYTTRLNTAIRYIMRNSSGQLGPDVDLIVKQLDKHGLVIVNKEGFE